MSHLGVEGPASLFDAVRAETAVSGRRQVVVADDADAVAALRLALDGNTLLIHAIAARPILDRLYDDLRRLGGIDVRTAESIAPAAQRLGAEELALLERLAAGLTLRAAATELSLSLRTADRRLAGARAKLGVSTTGAAVSAMARARPGGPEAPG